MQKKTHLKIKTSLFLCCITSTLVFAGECAPFFTVAALTQASQEVAVALGYTLHPMNLASLEAMSQTCPDRAIVASYMSPSKIRALDTLKIPYSSFDDLTDIDSIAFAICSLGKTLGKAEEAQALASTMLATAEIIAKDFPATKKRVLLLTEFSHFATPTHKVVCTDFLQRLHLENAAEPLIKNSSSFFLSLRKEQIFALKPDIIVFMSPKEKMSQNRSRLCSEPSFAQSTILVVDEALMNTPTHRSVLGLKGLSLALRELL